LALLHAQDELAYRDFSNAPGLQAVGSAQPYGQVLRLTQAKRFQRGAAWRTDRIPVRDGVETAFRFRISQPGGRDRSADGFAFVIQNNGPEAIAGVGGSGGFAVGHRSNDASAPAIENSLAVFFDTHQNEEDESGNAVLICTNTGPKDHRWPPPRLAANWNLKIRLKDSREHEARILFVPPLLTVHLDEELVLRAPVDLARMVGPEGKAFVGFTSATGKGYANHDILDWRFRPAVTSNICSVTSEISFARCASIPEKGLCTPAAAVIDEDIPGHFHVILPAQLAWGASIPNPNGRPVSIKNPKGAACWEPASGGCGGFPGKRESEPGALRIKTENGRTYFGIVDNNLGDNEGYYEFEVEFEP